MPSVKSPVARTAHPLWQTPIPSPPVRPLPGFDQYAKSGPQNSEDCFTYWITSCSSGQMKFNGQMKYLGRGAQLPLFQDLHVFASLEISQPPPVLDGGFFT